jgi:hypothetical protein
LEQLDEFDTLNELVDLKKKVENEVEKSEEISIQV